MSRKVNEISDDQLFKCMKDYLDNPTRYHPEYLQLLISDYERRVKERIEQHGGHPKNYTPDPSYNDKLINDPSPYFGS